MNLKKIDIEQKLQLLCNLDYFDQKRDMLISLREPIFDKTVDVSDNLLAVCDILQFHFFLIYL